MDRVNANVCALQASLELREVVRTHRAEFSDEISFHLRSWNSATARSPMHSLFAEFQQYPYPDPVA